MSPAVGVPISMAKHPTRSAVKGIGAQRVRILLELSQEAAGQGREDRAIRYVGLARAICGKAQMDMPREFRFCGGCLLPLIPGSNCTVRLTGHKIVSECRRCGTVWRMPYLKEQRRPRQGNPAEMERDTDDREGSEEGAA